MATTAGRATFAAAPVRSRVGREQMKKVSARGSILQSYFVQHNVRSVTATPATPATAVETTVTAATTEVVQHLGRQDTKTQDTHTQHPKQAVHPHRC